MTLRGPVELELLLYETAANALDHVPDGLSETERLNASVSSTIHYLILLGVDLPLAGVEKAVQELVATEDAHDADCSATRSGTRVRSRPRSTRGCVNRCRTMTDAATELARQPHWRVRVLAAVKKSRRALEARAARPSDHRLTCGCVDGLFGSQALK
jgi:hypothetical protein